MITSPGDVRLLRGTEASIQPGAEGLHVRAKVWSKADIRKVYAQIGGSQVALKRVESSNVWQGLVSIAGKTDIEVQVWVEDTTGNTGEDAIQVALGVQSELPLRMERDLDNALAAWPEAGLLGTQLGQKKHGRKW